MARTTGPRLGGDWVAIPPRGRWAGGGAAPTTRDPSCFCFDFCQSALARIAYVSARPARESATPGGRVRHGHRARAPAAPSSQNDPYRPSRQIAPSVALALSTAPARHDRHILNIRNPGVYVANPSVSHRPAVHLLHLITRQPRRRPSTQSAYTHPRVPTDAPTLRRRACIPADAPTFRRRACALLPYNRVPDLTARFEPRRYATVHKPSDTGTPRLQPKYPHP